jgi:hypothetical protein
MAGDFLVTRPDLFPAIIYNFYRTTNQAHHSDGRAEMSPHSYLSRGKRKFFFQAEILKIKKKKYNIRFQNYFPLF